MEMLRSIIPLPTELVNVVLEFSDLPYNTHAKKIKLNRRLKSLSHEFHNKNPGFICHFPGLYFFRWLIHRGTIKRRTKKCYPDVKYYNRIRDLMIDTYEIVGGLFRM